MTVKQLLKKNLDNGDVSVKEWNEGIYIWVVYRICWKSKNSYLVFSFENEEQAKEYCKSHGAEYFYNKLKIN